MILPLRYENDPILKQVAVDVDLTKLNEIKPFAINMLETMRANDGLGLAAPQVGVLQRIIVVAFEPYVLINPVYVEDESSSRAKQKHIEGCLSFPGLFLEVERYQQVLVVYKDVEGEAHEQYFSGKQSVAIQHEVDHLNGIVFTEKVKQMALLHARMKRKK